MSGNPTTQDNSRHRRLAEQCAFSHSSGEAYSYLSATNKHTGGACRLSSAHICKLTTTRGKIFIQFGNCIVFWTKTRSRLVLQATTDCMDMNVDNPQRPKLDCANRTHQVFPFFNHKLVARASETSRQDFWCVLRREQTENTEEHLVGVFVVTSSVRERDGPSVHPLDGIEPPSS